MSTPEANTGTKPVAAQHAFDVAALERYLAGHLPGFAGPLVVEQFKGGQSNPTYKLLTPARAYVLRSKPGPASKLLPSAHAVDREFTVMRGLADTAVPVPACTSCARTRVSSAAPSTSWSSSPGASSGTRRCPRSTRRGERRSTTR
jgi:hypothetical protein